MSSRSVSIPAVPHDAASRLHDRLGEYLVSLIYYPENVYQGGLVAVFRDDAEPFVDLIAEAYKYVPLAIYLHCIRQNELPELCWPAFTWIHVLNRHIQLPYLIKHHGIVLYGRDVRDEMPALPEPEVLFKTHLESCAHFVRNHAVLRLLALERYSELVKRIDWQIKCLMVSGLLVSGDGDGSFASIPARFLAAYRNEEFGKLWREFSELKTRMNVETKAGHRRFAFEAVWLFECFLRQLRDTCNENKNC